MGIGDWGLGPYPGGEPKAVQCRRGKVFLPCLQYSPVCPECGREQKAAWKVCLQQLCSRPGK